MPLLPIIKTNLITGVDFEQTMEQTRAHLKITGRVQGVGFRNSTRRKARQLGVNGWVRNLPNGSVEAVVEGNKEDVEDLIAWAKRGPRLASVNEVKLEQKEPKNEFETFSIRY